MRAAPSIADQLSAAEAAHTPAPVAATPAPRGMGARGIPSKGGARGAKPVPPSLLLLGVVEHDEPVVKAEEPKAEAEAKAAKKPAAKKKAAKADGEPKAKKPAAKKKAKA